MKQENKEIKAGSKKGRKGEQEGQRKKKKTKIKKLNFSTFFCTANQTSLMRRQHAERDKYYLMYI